MILSPKSVFETFARHTLRAPLDGVERIDPRFDHVGDDCPAVAIVMMKYEHARLVRQVDDALHPRQQECADMFFRKHQVVLPAHILGHVRKHYLARDGFINALSVDIGQIEQLIQAVVHDFWIFNQVHHGLFLAAQVLVNQERLGSAALDGIIFPTFNLLRNDPIIEPIWAGPAVIRLDLLHRAVLRQRVGFHLGIRAGAVLYGAVGAAKHIRIRRELWPGVFCSHMDDKINVQAAQRFVQRPAGFVWFARVAPGAV